MKTINLVYSQEAILTDENNNSITAEILESVESCVNLVSYALLYEDREDYLHILDTWENVDFMLHKLLLAYYLKKALPETTIRFSNTDNYYDLPTDALGFATWEQDFVLSDYAFIGLDKEVRIMFDYCSTGLWDNRGREIITDMLPCVQSTKDCLSSFAKGLDSMRIPYDDDFSEEEERLSASYMDLGMKGAIALKNELPDWKITFHNYDQYYDLPIDEHSDSEILAGMRFEQRVEET